MFTHFTIWVKWIFSTGKISNYMYNSLKKDLEFSICIKITALVLKSSHSNGHMGLSDRRRRWQCSVCRQCPRWLTWCWWRCGRPPMADLMLVALWQAPMADLMLVALWQAPHSWPDVGGVVAGQHVELLLPHREQWVVHHLQHPKQQQHSTLYTVCTVQCTARNKIFALKGQQS